MAFGGGQGYLNCFLIEFLVLEISACWPALILNGRGTHWFDYALIGTA
jgi:hypothetical protein